MPTQKIVIKIDTAPHGYVFTPSQVTIANFDVVKNIKVAPKSLLLAHKLVTIFQRKRAKGRDFWDIMFLLQTTRTPDRGYISAQMGINTPQNLKQKLSELCQKLDFKFLQKDVAPFLFDPYDQKVELFPEYIQTIDFS